MNNDFLLLLISLCHCEIILFLHSFVLRLFFLSKVPSDFFISFSFFFNFFFFVLFWFFFYSLIPSSTGKRMQLIAFSMGNVDRARNLQSEVQFYFGVKSRTKSGQIDRKSLWLFASFQSLGNHYTPLSEGSSSSLIFSSTKYVSLSIYN